MVIINSNIYDLASEPQTLEALQNVFILIIVARFTHVMHTFYLREKVNVLGAAVFT